MNKISCVIPAYNEAQTIAATLRVVTDPSAGVDEVIVVDDGSLDATKDLVRKYPGVKLLVNETNRGKSATIARGILEASGDYILMLDADLEGIKPHNITDLARPIMAGKADVSMSMRFSTPRWMKMIGVDLMTGERIFSKNMIAPYLDEMSSLPSFALELFLNKITIHDKLRIASVMMSNVKNPLKWQKRTFWKGVKAEIGMWRNIHTIVTVREWIYQNLQLKRLLVK